jgi:hypothetical protein
MADGDAVLQDIVAGVYQDDDGNYYTHRVKSFYQAQAGLGWTLNSDDSRRPLPRGYKPRVWLVQNAADHTQRARVVVATNAAYIAGVLGTTTIKMIYRGYELTMTVYGREGERHRGLIQDTGVQAELPA